MLGEKGGIPAGFERCVEFRSTEGGQGLSKDTNSMDNQELVGKQ
jgi:hypothetical protein